MPTRGTETVRAPGRWRVYVLRCADGTLYTGITTDTGRRLDEHNGRPGTARRGAAYTRARRPVRLVWSAPAADRAEASRRERAIKRLSRAAKERLLDASGDACKPAVPRPPSAP